MPLTAGTRLGPYEILAPIGAGGMGEVYKARDTRLDRVVAIKVSKEEFSERFEREARNVAALNHPNICTLHDIGPNYLVMEFVEGEMLSGPLPLETALNYSRQIAEAIEAAHEKGIVHRDLKPANIKVTPEGSIKVLDFGLAKALDAELPAAPAQDSPTLSMAMTRAGMILGTAAYMSPEQAKGRPADRRADIWAFGVVLYEILVGKQFFTGDTAAETLASVLKEPISLDRLPKDTPPALRNLLARCLERDLRRRLQAIGEARIVLEGPLNAPEAPVPSPSREGGGKRSWIPWAVAAVGIAAAVVLAFLHFRETPPPERTLRYTIAAPENSNLHSLAISPDGRNVVIATASGGKRQLWLRALDTLQAQPMPFTEDASYPFWSPDSRYIGFFAQGKLKKIAATGGPAQSLCDVPNSRGGSWSRDDVIVFSPNGGGGVAIQRVSAAGGVPSDITKTKGDYKHPVFLPDGRHFLYLASNASEKNGVHVASLDGTEDRRLLADVSSVTLAPGYLLFVRENTLMAQPFDVQKAQTSGDVFPVIEGVSLTTNSTYAPVTASDTGTLLYSTGGVTGGRQISWLDRNGKLLSLVGAPGIVISPAVSPDEKTVAFSRGNSTGQDILLRDLARGTDIRLTADASQNLGPFWSPKGDFIAFTSDRGGGQYRMYRRAASGAGKDELLVSSTNSNFVTQWSRDGRFIVYTELSKGKTDIFVLPTLESADRKPMVFVNTEFNELLGQLSADSRWMAYTSDESGQKEVYVRPFPPAEGRWKISTAGGEQPRWRGDGKELFYVAADGKLTAVPVKAWAGPKPSFEPGTPMALFDPHITNTAQLFQYDVTADGKRFLVDTNVATASSVPLTVVVNWNTGQKK